MTERERERIDRQAEKLARIVGERPPDQWLQNKVQELAPWYLRPEHTSQSEIVLNPDGGVRAATLPALIERLTMHDGSGGSLALVPIFFQILICWCGQTRSSTIRS